MAARDPDAVYLYGLARASALSVIEAAAGPPERPERPGAPVTLLESPRLLHTPSVDGEHGLGLIRSGDVVAVVSRVDASDFSGPAAGGRMRDPEWIGSRVCRHHRVVEDVRRASPVVPARFAVLFSSPERVREWLVAHEDAVTRALDHLTGRDEWAVKVTLDRPRAEAALLRRCLEAEAVTSSPGTRYLRERRARATVGRELDEWLAEMSARISRELAACVVDARDRGVGTGAISTWAFLVARDAVEAFASRIAAINAGHDARGITLEVSGPWPPYSFCPPLESPA